MMELTRIINDYIDFLYVLQIVGMEITKEEILKRLQQIHLIPFYALVTIYYITYQPFWSYPPETLTAALFKSLPVWALAWYVRTCAGDRQTSLLPEQDYHRFLFVGLLFSSLGDAALIARETMFVPGMLLFAIAHVFYLCALEPGSNNSRYKPLFILGCIGSYLFIENGMDSVVMKFLVLIYSVLIFSVGWRAASKFEREQSYPALLGLFGILSFLFSDFIIGVNKWKFYVPFNEMIVMTTYYLGQLGIALSADTKQPK